MILTSFLDEFNANFDREPCLLQRERGACLHARMGVVEHLGQPRDDGRQTGGQLFRRAVRHGGQQLHRAHL